MCGLFFGPSQTQGLFVDLGYVDIRKLFNYPVILVGFLTFLGFAVIQISQSGLGSHEESVGTVWDGAQCLPVGGVEGGASSTGIAGLDFLTGDGLYMPRTHCLPTQEGSTDWTFVWLLVGLNSIVIAGYLKIFVFWRKAYMQEEPEDRNTKLMDLAWIFLWCAICGYVSSIVLFFWPGYRLLALALVPLGFFTWKFASNLDEFRISLGAKRLARQLNESLVVQNDRLKEEVACATRVINEARIHAEEANHAKSEFLARMSHEIRTPMVAILGFIDLSADPKTTSEEQREYLDIAQRNSRHLLSLINDVLDISKIESGEMSYESIPCSIKDIAQDTQSLLNGKAAEKGVRLVLDLDPGTPQWISSDPTRLKQVLTNLVGNAIKFTEYGSVTVSTAVDHSEKAIIEINVMDTGVGIPANKIDAVFEEFTQASSSTTRRFGGTGLGLAISRRIIEDLGGSISVTSELDRGSCFTILLPVEVLEDYTPGIVCQETSVNNAIHMLEGKRILVVEDMQDNRVLIKHRFKKANITNIEFAVDGVDAIDMVRWSTENPFDLIFTDIDMPRMDGFEFTKKIREMGHRTPVIVLSAHAMATERERALRCGAQDYCTKPIDFPHLVQTCARVLGGGDDQGIAA